MNSFPQALLRDIYRPSASSHKGQNGKLLVIGGSVLFHAASLWALTIASRIVDIVFYSSVEENNNALREDKKLFTNGIIIPRNKLRYYIEEADCILIGPGLPRKDGQEKGDDNTQELTETLLRAYPLKRWVIDGGSLQVINPRDIPAHAIITPHHNEFLTLFHIPPTKENIEAMSIKYNITILSKGLEDVICSAGECYVVAGGNAGMTKGGTGDVLAGLVGALYAKNPALLSAAAGSLFNKKAGESLEEKVGYYFNASDLCDEIPYVMKQYILDA